MKGQKSSLKIAKTARKSMANREKQAPKICNEASIIDNNASIIDNNAYDTRNNLSHIVNHARDTDTRQF